MHTRPKGRLPTGLLRGFAARSLLPWLAALGAAGLLAQGAYQRVTGELGHGLPGGATPPAASVAGSTEAATGSQASALTALSQWHLFGEQRVERPAEKKPEPVPEKRPVTKLNLTLLGLLFSTDGSDDLAIIANGSNDEKTFRVGDELFKLATLTEIHGDHVVLQRQGRYEELRIQRESAGLDVDPSHDDERVAVPDMPAGTARDEEMPVGDLILDHVDLQEQYSESGEFEGLSMAATDDRGQALLKAAGIGEDDRVISINGQQLTAGSALALTLIAFRDALPVRIGILRQGQPLNIVLPGSR